MKPRLAPTSPKYAGLPETSTTVNKIWNQPGTLTQPPRWPWGRLGLLIVSTTIIGCALVIAATLWFMHRAPASRLARWWVPLATTIVQSAPEAVMINGNLPKAVSKSASTILGLAADQGATGIYSNEIWQGYAWPLSSNGWSLGWRSTWTVETPQVLIPILSAPVSLTKTVTDPATSFIFFKVKDLNQAPVTLSKISELSNPHSVWVVGRAIDQPIIIPRQLLPGSGPAWTASDTLENYWRLDQPVNLKPGAGVLDDRGRLVGLLDQDQRVWPVESIDAMLKSVIQQGSLERPALGVRYLNFTQAIKADQTVSTGLLIGAAGDQLAVELKSAAEVAGLKKGDLITKLNGQTILTDLYVTLQSFRPGDRLTMTYVRDQVTKDVEVVLKARRP